MLLHLSWQHRVSATYFALQIPTPLCHLLHRALVPVCLMFVACNKAGALQLISYSHQSFGMTSIHTGMSTSITKCGWHLRTRAATKSDTSRISHLFAFKYSCLGNLARGFAMTRVGPEGVCHTHETELDHTHQMHRIHAPRTQDINANTPQPHAHTGVFAAFD